MHVTMSDLPILFQGVSFAAAGAHLVSDITLRISPGGPTVLIGPNGSGKTTLLRLAMGLMKPTSGHISWGGRGNAASHRRAIMFQRPTMLRRSATANIDYALASIGVPRANRARQTSELLDMVGLPELGSRPARKLSGGEQQRLALARALAQHPELLFLDEPTAALDPTSTKAIEDVLRAVALRGVKIVMATHDLAEARRLANDIVFLNRGRIIEAAPAAKFFDNPATDEGRKFIAGELLI